MFRTRADEVPLCKVAVELEPGAWHGCAEETMWARSVGEDLYELHNTPFSRKGWRTWTLWPRVQSRAVDRALDVLRVAKIDLQGAAAP